jgi:2-amino-4-hydroxy-6-hydroxymethyldihydropteridine diphosphokinase
MPEALIALGGNVGDARATLDSALAQFCDGALVRLVARSAHYRTPPWGVADQPPFINMCAIIDTSLPPRRLLERAQGVERQFGRDRMQEQRWGPRTLDIDILAYGDVSLSEPGLVLPHPRLFERAFVLVPLAEIAPDRLIAGTSVRDALARVDSSGIERLPR